jgi:hypothetical protein
MDAVCSGFPSMDAQWVPRRSHAPGGRGTTSRRARTWCPGAPAVEHVGRLTRDRTTSPGHAGPATHAPSVPPPRRRAAGAHGHRPGIAGSLPFRQPHGPAPLLGVRDLRSPAGHAKRTHLRRARLKGRRPLLDEPPHRPGSGGRPAPSAPPTLSDGAGCALADRHPDRRPFHLTATDWPGHPDDATGLVQGGVRLPAAGASTASTRFRSFL